MNLTKWNIFIALSVAILTAGLVIEGVWTAWNSSGNSKLAKEQNKLAEKQIELTEIQNELTKKHNELIREISADKFIPKLQITPVDFIKDYPYSSQAGVKYVITNYTNFDAVHVEWDLKYINASWILSWNKAQIKNLEQKGSKMTLQENADLQGRKFLVFTPKTLEANSSFTDIIAGNVNVDDLLKLSKEKDGYPIKLKLSWKSRKGQFYEKLEEYKLFLTGVGDAEQFSFEKKEYND